MEKSGEQIANFVELSFSTVNLILCRSEFNQYRKRTKYNVNIHFIDEMIKCFENKKTRKYLDVKYSKAQTKLYQWRRKLMNQNEVRN